MKRRGPCRRDANHDELLRFADTIPGLVVVDTHEVGPKCIPGFPDALLVWRGRLLPIEIKAGDGTLTAGEDQLAKAWRGAGVEVTIVRSKGELVRLLGIHGWREDNVRETAAR